MSGRGVSWQGGAVIACLAFAAGMLTDVGMRHAAHPDEPQPLAEVAATDHRAVAPARPAQPARRVDTSRESRSVGTSGISDEPAVEALRRHDLEVPVEGVHRRDLRDTYGDTRSGARPHEALDIMADRGTPVRAVENGTIEKLFTSKAGGLTVYQFEPSGTYCYYYAHLDRYAAGIHEGQAVHKGDLLGYVGSTGNAAADAPHLHFAIFRLTPERKWWKGEPINPYPVLR